jgi:hypothetical protein
MDCLEIVHPGRSYELGFPPSAQGKSKSAAGGET